MIKVIVATKMSMFFSCKRTYKERNLSQVAAITTMVESIKFSVEEATVFMIILFVHLLLSIRM